MLVENIERIRPELYAIRHDLDHRRSEMSDCERSVSNCMNNINSSSELLDQIHSKLLECVSYIRASEDVISEDINKIDYLV